MENLTKHSRVLVAMVILFLLMGLLACSSARSEDAPRTEDPNYIRLKARIVALDHVRVIDGTGAHPREEQTVLIVDGKIVSVMATLDAVVPEDAVRMDLSSQSVLPGLIMVHEHMMYFSGRAIWHSQPISYPPLYLAAGVTTVRTAGSDYPFIDLNLRLRIENGETPGPRMHVTGPFFNGEEDGFIGDVTVRTEEDGRREVRYWAERGATSFKVYASISLPAIKGIISEAHALGLTVAGHLGSIGCLEAAELGIDSIEHSFAECGEDLGVTKNSEEFIRRLVTTGVTLTATPSNAFERISAGELALLHPETRSRYLEIISGDLPEWWPDPASELEIRKLERAFVAAGGNLVLGADAADFGQIAGFSNHRVLILMVEAGFSPLEVIRMATLDGARFLGVDDRLGSIRKGNIADLMVVTGNPADNIRDIENVKLVFKDGIAYDPILLRESVKGLVGWH